MFYESEYLAHYGVPGQKWGMRRFQNEDGTLTAEGRSRYGVTGEGRGSGKKKMSGWKKAAIGAGVGLAAAAAGYGIYRGIKNGRIPRLGTRYNHVNQPNLPKNMALSIRGNQGMSTINGLSRINYADRIRNARPVRLNDPNYRRALRGLGIGLGLGLGTTAAAVPIGLHERKSNKKFNKYVDDWAKTPEKAPKRRKR